MLFQLFFFLCICVSPHSPRTCNHVCSDGVLKWKLIDLTLFSIFVSFHLTIFATYTQSFNLLNVFLSWWYYLCFSTFFLLMFNPNMSLCTACSYNVFHSDNFVRNIDNVSTNSYYGLKLYESKCQLIFYCSFIFFI